MFDLKYDQHILYCYSICISIINLITILNKKESGIFQFKFFICSNCLLCMQRENQIIIFIKLFTSTINENNNIFKDVF